MRILTQQDCEYCADNTLCDQYGACNKCASMLKERALKVQKVTHLAGDAFWAEVAKQYPEITTGDFPPDATFIIEQAMHDAIQVWIESNTQRP